MEKRSIVYISSKIEQARIHRVKMEKVDAVGRDAMFGDEDLAYDLQLEKFGVDTAVLKEPVVQRIVRAYVEDWEEEGRMNNNCVTDARFRAKYGGLVFFDPDSESEKMFTVYNKNMEFHRGRGNGWHVLAANSNDEYEAFTLEIACEVIGETQQAAGIMVVHREG